MPSSPIRALFVIIAVMLGTLAAAVVGVGMLLSHKHAPAPPSAAVYRVPLNGVIELGLAPFVERSLADAARAGARAIVLDMDTPGGRINAADQIVNAIQKSPVPVYTFVDRRAFSAGALIALATRRIYMKPGAVIGAATPVNGSGEKAPEKIVSAMRSEMRALAEQQGLDPRVAEAMVDEDVAIDGVVAQGKLLTLTTDEAVRIGYAQPAADLDGVLAAVGVPATEVHDTQINWAESLVRFLSNPAVAPLLLVLGFLGVVIEIKAHAFGLAGLIGLGSLGLFFGSRYLVGLAGMEEMILLGVGILLLLLEAFVIPGFGIAGIAGIAAVGTSIFLSLLPHFATSADVATAAGVVSIAAITVVLIVWALLRHLPRSGRFARSGLMLEESTSRDVGYQSAEVRHELVGADGVALTDLRPSGVAKIGEERVDVEAESSWISAGTPVRVMRSEGYRHIVRAVR